MGMSYGERLLLVSNSDGWASGCRLGRLRGAEDLSWKLAIYASILEQLQLAQNRLKPRYESWAEQPYVCNPRVTTSAK